MTTGEDDNITVESTPTGYGQSDTHDHNNTHVLKPRLGHSRREKKEITNVCELSLCTLKTRRVPVLNHDNVGRLESDCKTDYSCNAYHAHVHVCAAPLSLFN